MKMAPKINKQKKLSLSQLAFDLIISLAHISIPEFHKLTLSKP